MVRQGTSGKNGSKPKGTASRQSARPPVAAVYRRRRLFVAVILLVVLAVGLGGFAVVSAVVNGASEQASSTDRSAGATAAASASALASTGASASASPTPSATSATPTCDLNLVTVSASTDKGAYAAGENPVLSMKVTNGGKAPCEVNLGTSQMEYTITSGSDRIFSSADCQSDSGDLVKTIAPGQSETANFPWQRNRTVPGCAAVAAKPGSGGAYYIFIARLGNKTSPKAVFQLN
ncbi:hypothetical protein [Arthrobacter sp. 92]|uniref:hypothetical protein n=1 Tax=Arthrobacter sp. 92 TaxID=3418175 RepID=UPI003D078149